ncbi:MAG TPA: hypothetical protein VEG30_11120 [Terriglobales bacterium]|nr:hypothetical protein [Terriglobales bacterium]
MLSFSDVCPRCQTSEQLYSSRIKNAVERAFLQATYLQAVRCHACYKRFYLPRVFQIPRAHVVGQPTQLGKAATPAVAGSNDSRPAA